MSLPRAGITLFLPFKTTSPWTSETCSSAIGSLKYSVYNNQSHLTSYNTLLTMPLSITFDKLQYTTDNAIDGAHGRILGESYLLASFGILA